MNKTGYLRLFRLLLGVLACAAYFPVAGQTLPALPLQCLSLEAPTKYTPLRRALGTARVVMLGEQTHYDGATFAAKIDLIRYLHDSLGFTTLAFEGDMYALDKARREVAAGTAVLPVLQKSVYEGIWSGTAEFQALAAYLGTHPKLRLAGFDCQLSGEYSAEQLLPELRDFVAQDRRTAWKEADFYPAQELLAELSGGDFKQLLRHPADTVALSRWFKRVRASLTYLAAHQPAQAGRAAFWQQWLQTTARYAQDEKSAARGRKEVAQNPRDALMADNLLFLTRQPEHPKIIVWAASYHLANRVELLELDDSGTAAYVRRMQVQQRLTENEDEPLTARQLLGGAVPMGRLVKQALGNQVYALGFVAHEGTYGRTGDTTSLHPVLIPPPGSVEAAFYREGCAEGFVDLRHSPPGNYYAAPLGYLPLRGPWGDIFDGLYYIRTMRPTTPLAAGIVAAAPVTGRQLRGQVRDAKSGAALSFASVGIRGTATGTVTNLAGDFVLFVPTAHARDTVQISCLGYASVRLAQATAQPPLRIQLVPQAHLLGEVVVRAPPSAATILRNARERIVANYPQQAHSVRLYSRAQYWRDDSLRVQTEAALDGYDREGYRRGSWEHGSKQRFLQLRQQRKTGDVTRPEYREPPAFWLLWADDPVLTTRNPLEAGALPKYTLALKGVTQYENRAVYEVAFVCNRPSAFTTPYGYPAPEAYEGSIFVDAENFAVVKYEAFTTRSPTELTKPKEFKRYGLTQPATGRRTHHDVYQYADVNGTYFRQYARRETNWEFALRGSADHHRWRDVHELLTTGVELARPVELHTSLYEVDSNVPYRAEFWETYQVLLPTQAEK
ncbi:MAG TPA: erythromycin esterase family protein [Hymenobacter sp.]|jgi:erythromycin esterase-like protein|uniref:erythromycin esterase family protein n=1 Tax=Hymenobacter sp. TaxID=1898978 RepID=UPI002ED7C014